MMNAEVTKSVQHLHSHENSNNTTILPITEKKKKKKPRPSVFAWVRPTALEIVNGVYLKIGIHKKKWK